MSDFFHIEKKHRAPDARRFPPAKPGYLYWNTKYFPIPLHDKCVVIAAALNIKIYEIVNEALALGLESLYRELEEKEGAL